MNTVVKSAASATSASSVKPIAEAAAASGKVHNGAFFNDLKSCEEMGCPEVHRPGAPCQCEDQCVILGNCCWDYGKCGNHAYSRKKLAHNTSMVSNVSSRGMPYNSSDVIYP
jgi:hypothetical protein